MSNNTTAKRMTGGIVAIIVLAICLCITTFALVYATVSVGNNLFHTAKVAINLNDGQPVIEEHAFLFEPGMTVKKDFFIENESTWSVYYKIYFDNISGGLADVLEVTLQDGEKTLFTGKAKDWSADKVMAFDDILQAKQKKTLTIVFHFPENEGNAAQNQDLNFTLCAEAVQTKNNPNKLFG